MALPDFTGQYIQNTYQRVLQKSGSGDIVDGTGSLFIPPNAISASYADFAVSASHEIIKEISSSHADRSDFASSGNGIFSGSFSGSYVGDGGSLTGISPFPFTGDAQITGSLTISGSFNAFTVDVDDVVLGDGAGASMTAYSAGYNVLIGKQAGDSIVTYGVQNVSIGRQAGRGDTNKCVSIGSYAGYHFKYGKTGNIAIGYAALSNGEGTWANVADGQYNVAMGYKAGRNITDGNNNTLIGTSAGQTMGGYNAGGSGNTLLGYYAGYSLTTADGNIIIGSGSLGAAGIANQLRIGNGNSLTTISASLLTGDIIFPSTASAEYFVGDGSNLTGITAATSLTQSIFVTQNGNDSTAVVGDLHLPFATLASASQAATTGSVIFVYPGLYVAPTENLAKPGVDWYFNPGATVSKSAAGDVFDISSFTDTGMNVYGYGDFILGSSAGALMDSINAAGPDFDYTFQCRDIFSDSTTAIVDHFTPDERVANWEFRNMSASAGHGFYANEHFNDGILNITCNEIIAKEYCIGTFNGFRGGFIKAKRLTSSNNFAVHTYSMSSLGLTLLVDEATGVGGDGSSLAYRFTTSGKMNIVGNTSGIQLGNDGGGAGVFTEVVNHTGKCAHLAIEGLSGTYTGGSVGKCDSFSPSTGIAKFDWDPSTGATDDYIKVAGGNVLATWAGQIGGYSNTIEVTGGRLVLDGYGKDQHAYKTWTISGGEFIFSGIADKFHNNGTGYGQAVKVITLSGGVCKIQGTINMAPALGGSQKMISYTGGKLILDGATLITTGSYAVVDLDQDRDVHIFSGGVNCNQTGSNALLQASGSGYTLTNVLGGMIIEDSSIE